MQQRPPFDVTRACFYLLAIVVSIMMLETLIALLGCVWIIVATLTQPSCGVLGTQIRELMAELLTAILALIASRGPPPSRPPEP
jgi:hypothetical protein